MFAKWASHLDVDRRDKHGHDGKGEWEHQKIFELAPTGMAPHRRHASVPPYPRLRLAKPALQSHDLLP